MLNVFYLPSWFPTYSCPINGIFIKEQIAAIHSTNQVNCVVCLWGQPEENIPLNKPLSIPKWLYNFCNSNFNSMYEPYREYCSDAVFDRVLSWSHRMPFGGHLRLYPHVRNLFLRATQKHGSFDCIHAYVSYPAGYIAYLLSMEFNVPYFLTEFMGPFPFKCHQDKHGKPRHEIILATKNAIKTVVLSSYLYDRFIQLGLTHPLIIPFSVDTNKFSLGSLNVASSTEIRLISCSRLVKEKGIYDLVDAFCLAAKKIKNLHLTIIGGGPEYNNLTRHITQLGLGSQITLTNQLPNAKVADYLRNSDIFILASHFDTFGVVFVEALSAGLPVIATKCGGPDSFISPELGILCPIHSPLSLSNAIINMCRNLHTFSRQNIRALAIRNFSHQSVSKQIVELYHETLMK